MNMWFREDIARILAATYETMRVSSSAVREQSTQEAGYLYEQGFADALRVMAVAFGLNIPGDRGRPAQAAVPALPAAWPGTRRT